MPEQANIPFVRAIDSSYENLFAECPHCGAVNIFNRATDLHTFSPVARQLVTCQESDCTKPFFVGRDLINPCWQMLILDCETLKPQKRYSYCILNLAQSFEIYFSLYLRVELLYRPYAYEKSYDLDRFNSLFAAYVSTISKFTFYPMCGLFIRMLLQPPSVKTLSEAERVINNLPSMCQMPADDEIKAYADPQFSQLLLDLKNTNVPKLRNNVVHKQAHRPTLSEVEESQEETHRLLYALDHRLGVLSDDLNYYMALVNGG